MIAVYLAALLLAPQADCNDTRIAWLHMRGDMLALSAELGAPNKAHVVVELSATVTELRLCER